MRDHIINKAGLEALLMDDYFKFIEERKKMMKNEFKTTGFLRNLIDQETVDD